MRISFKELKENRVIYQSHNVLKLHQEFLIKKIKESVLDILYWPIRLEDLELIDSILAIGVEKLKSSIWPSTSAKITENNRIKIFVRNLKLGSNIVKIDYEFKILPETINKILEAKNLFKEKTKNSQIFKIEIKNKKNWSIDYIKFTIPLALKKDIKKIELFCLKDLSSGEKNKAMINIENNSITWIDKFGKNQSKIFEIKFSFKKIIKDYIEVSPLMNGSYLFEGYSIPLIPGKSFEGYQKFVDLLKKFTNEFWWFEQHFDRDCLNHIKKLDFTKVKSIKILTGPAHMNKTFQTSFNLLKSDLEQREIDCELKVVLDTNSLTSIHGRYFFDDNLIYNAPPGNLLNKAVFDSIVPVSPGIDERKHIKRTLWPSSTPFSRWDKIQKFRDEHSESLNI